MSPQPDSTIPGLDGLRALAVMLVFFAHSGLENIVPGGLGVTLFFVLSGYLITTLMRAEHQRTGAIRFRAFYLRRCLRLMPPLLLIMTAAGTLAHFGIDEGGFSRGGAASVLFYFGNYYAIASHFHGLPAGVGVVWSLAVEEHFYLFYPPLALLLLRWARPRLAAIVLAGLCGLVLFWRCWLALNGSSEDYIGMATDTRIDAILVGCLMGIAANPWLEPAAMQRRRDLLIAATCLAVLMATLLIRNELFRMTARYTLQSLAIAPLIYLAVARSRKPAFGWLNSPPLVYLGQISYTVYLSHQVILFCVAKTWPHGSWLEITAATAVLTLAIAAPMRVWIDQPFARLRRRLHRRAAPAVELPMRPESRATA